jgi:MFS family permease
VPVLTPGLAAGIYAAAGPRVLVLVLLGLYAVSIPILLLVPAPRPVGTDTERGSVCGEMLAGLRYLLANSLLVRLSLVAFVALLGMGGLSVIDVVFVTRALHLHSEVVGVLLTAYGAGSLTGGVAIWLVNRWAARRYHLVLGLAVIGNGLMLVLYALAPNLAVAAVALFLCGVGFPSVMVAWMTMAQMVTDDAFMGRVMSVTNMGMAVAMIASLGGSGALTDALGVRWVIALGAGIFLTSGLLSLVLIRATPEPRASAVPPPIELTPPADLADAV